MKKLLLAICCLLFITEASFGQSSRDMVKAGGGYNLLTLEDVFVPAAYVEFSRVFYPPVSLAVTLGYSSAKDIELIFEDHDLETFHFDFSTYYSFTDDNPIHDIRPGFMLSARSFKTDWKNRVSGDNGTDRFFKLGLGFVLNYDAHIGDLFLAGLKASAALYNKENTVYFVGGHLGLSF